MICLSKIAFEFSFTAKRPVMFIDAPMKIMNSEYEKIEFKPITAAKMSPASSLRRRGDILGLVGVKSTTEPRNCKVISAACLSCALHIILRSVIGKSVKLDKLNIVTDIINEFLSNKTQHTNDIDNPFHGYVSNVGNSKKDYGKYDLKRFRQI